MLTQEDLHVIKFDPIYFLLWLYCTQFISKCYSKESLHNLYSKCNHSFFL